MDEEIIIWVSKEQLVFLRLTMIKLKKVRGLNITICTSAKKMMNRVKFSLDAIGILLESNLVGEFLDGWPLDFNKNKKRWRLAKHERLI